MSNGKRPRVLSERRGKWLLNLFPPWWFSRIRVTEVGEGFRRIKVRVARSRLTGNLNGTTFGGTIFSAADPLHAVLYWQVFARRGERVQVWLKSSSVDYLKPAATDLVLEAALSDEDIERADAELRRSGRFVRRFRTEAVDRLGEVCAVIETEVYLRRPRREQREISAF